MGFFDAFRAVEFNADGSVRKSGGGNSPKKKTAKKTAAKNDFDKEYKILVKSISILKMELEDCKKLASTKQEMKKIQVLEDRILNIV